MNLVGKIFVGVISTMSIVVLALALTILARHEDWRKVAIAHQEKVNSLESDKNALTTINTELSEQLQTAREQHNAAIEILTQQQSEIVSKYQSLFDAFDKYEKDLQKQVDDMTANSATITENRNIIEVLSAELERARKLRAGYLRDLTMTVNKQYDQTSVIENIQTKNAELVALYEKAKIVLDKKGLQADPSFYPTTPPFVVEGIILDLQKDDGHLLTISLGTSDGLALGNLLEVYREKTYLGRIQVVALEPNRAVCELIPEFRRGTFRVGDNVTSQFVP
ncbi:MAG: hypothetical protein Q4G68_00725 [Planctomycetia bacterium]|nr:hypothetical protein [Planctomycetia bacterium]